MKVLVIGGVAAGTKAAAKLKREDRSAEVRILTKGHDISYAGCGLPYYIGGMISDRSGLIVNTPGKFSALTGVSVLTGAEVTAVDFKEKSVTYVHDGSEDHETYDKLVITTGAVPIVPPVAGVGLDGVFTLRTPDDAQAIRAWAGKEEVRRAIVVGAGFIGLETAENLKKLGLSVTVVDMASQIMPKAFDLEMADWARRQLEAASIRVLTSAKLEAVEGDVAVKAVKTDKGLLRRKSSCSPLVSDLPRPSLKEAG